MYLFCGTCQTSLSKKGC
uniref:Uncharacterized protein n=1 Tax=Rhizophora mucronata TaxID=61149 RepID=A0A2P2NPT7_RHIMU